MNAVSFKNPSEMSLTSSALLTHVATDTHIYKQTGDSIAACTATEKSKTSGTYIEPMRQDDVPSTLLDD